MGPRLINRGNRLNSLRHSGLPSASMGPRLINRGNYTSASISSCFLVASMGPRLINRGNGNSPLSIAASCAGFNGAAVDQPRKCGGLLHGWMRTSVLQWGRG